MLAISFQRMREDLPAWSLAVLPTFVLEEHITQSQQSCWSIKTFSLENACDIYKPVCVKTMAQKFLYSYCQWDESRTIKAKPMTPQGEIKQTAGSTMVQHTAPHLLTVSVRKKSWLMFWKKRHKSVQWWEKIHSINSISNHIRKILQLKCKDLLSNGKDTHSVRKFQWPWITTY